MFNRKLLAGGMATIAMLIATQANAHTGLGVEATFATGLAHPFSGLDHVLAMAGIGLWAAQTGGRTIWQLPLAFVATLIIGALVGFGGTGLSALEIGVAGSVALLGLAIFFASRIPLWAGLGVAGLVGLFHGQAHAVEMPAAGSTTNYVLGFVLASLALHAIGAALGTISRRRGFAAAPRALGAAGAAAGIVMLAGLA